MQHHGTKTPKDLVCELQLKTVKKRHFNLVNTGHFNSPKYLLAETALGLWSFRSSTEAAHFYMLFDEDPEINSTL